MLKIIKKLNGFIFISLLLLSCSTGTGQASKTRLDPDAFAQKLAATPNAQLIDVRTPDEFQGGHLKGALNYDVSQPEFETQISRLDKSKPAFVYCLSGGRSAEAAQQMRTEGFTTVYELEGGIMKWNDAGKPLEKGTKSGSTEGIVPVADFQKSIESNAVVLADFSAPWCAPCRMLAPIVDSIADEQKGKLTVIKVDVDKNRDLTQQMQVTDLPTLLLFKNGKQVWRSEGLMPKSIIMDAIKNK